MPEGTPPLGNRIRYLREEVDRCIEEKSNKHPAAWKLHVLAILQEAREIQEHLRDEGEGEMAQILEKMRKNFGKILAQEESSIPSVVPTSQVPLPTPLPNPVVPPPEPEHVSPPSTTPPKREKEPTPEAAAEAPNFARYLRKILEDKEQRETLLTKLTNGNGRLWIDKKVKNTDGSERTVRIWLSVSLAPEDLAKPKEELFALVENKLKTFPSSLHFRMDDPAQGPSWKDRWTEKKNAMSSDAVAHLKARIEATSPSDAAAAMERVAQELGIADARKAAFKGLLAHYITQKGAKNDLWTHIRNAYWHADEWKDIAALPKELTWKPPAYETARIREWEKIEGNHRTLLESKIGTETTLHHRGTPVVRGPIAQKNISDGPAKGMWYNVGAHWVHAEHLRISYKYKGDGTKVDPPEFELMAWQVQTEGPKEPPPAAPPVSPKPPAAAPAGKPKNPSATPPPAIPPASPPKPKGPMAPPSAVPDASKPPPKTPSVVPPPAAKKKGGTDATPPTTAASGAVPAPKRPEKHGHAKTSDAVRPKVANTSNGTPAPVTSENLRKQLENAKDVLLPTAENLTEKWLRANRGKKLFLKLRDYAEPRPCIVGCLDSNQRHDTAGKVCLCCIHSSGKTIIWHTSITIAELRRLNLSPKEPPSEEKYRGLPVWHGGG